MGDDRGMLGYVQDGLTTTMLAVDVLSPFAAPLPPSDLAPPPEPFAIACEAEDQGAPDLVAALNEQALERHVEEYGNWQETQLEQAAEMEAQALAEGPPGGFEGGAGAL